MGSLDVDSLFTNIALDETIDIFVNQLFENADTAEVFTKSELKQLLCLATKGSYFILNGLRYKQIDGIAIGSPLGPSLANAFLSYHEKNWLNNCLQGFKPIFYQRYVDDIFVLFKSNDHLKYFQDFLNPCHINMSFSMETEKENKLPFSTLKLYANKVNLQAQFIEKLLLGVHIVTLKVFYLWFINLVWYIL